MKEAKSTTRKKIIKNIKKYPGTKKRIKNQALQFIEQQQLKKEKFRQLVTTQKTPYKTIQAQCQAICQEMVLKDINKIVKCYFSDPLVDQVIYT